MILDVGMLAVSQVALYFTIKYLVNQIDVGGDPDRKKQLDKGNKVLERIGLKDGDLDEHERTIAAEIISPEDMNVTFADIGGLDGIITSLRETVIFPLTHPQLFTSSSLLSAPKGVLLYGPPGCGKSMLAKALAKESGANFINISVSTLTNKWYGESNKLVHALFSLAKRLKPCIIFIDEIDCFLRERGKGDHEVTGMMKAEFMTQWDGLVTDKDSRILVLGATNRPNDIDPAILRRLPKRFAIRLPDRAQRLKILQLMLKNTPLSPTLSLDLLAAETEGLSGSDLHELCRNAAMHPLKEVMRREGGLEGVGADFKLRPLTLKDFLTLDGDVLPPPGTNEPIAVAKQVNSYNATISELEIDDLS
ncbi:probable MSP1-intra-mitochondrial sorting protein [Serendipita indica DSM 11827]|uniref:Probable MSP1-intra-mitochondrial sorting protein n=1 Tax=Serendipita indica (strain DSM 11827) TaxID=1109443 RepID=G4TUZ5_SERID|nr:probable MSP1-intra-mitochondrial sorting protein [Serendipita indica DSM 11827]